MMKLNFDELRALLGKPLDDSAIIAVIGGDPTTVERMEHYGSVVLKDIGIELTFKEAPYVLPPDEVTNPKALYLSSFHFHRQGHDGFAEYCGNLPNGIAFGDSEATVIHKIGEPTASGGGDISPVLRKRIERWVRYDLAHDAFLRVQFDDGGAVEMLTLQRLKPAERKTAKGGL